MQTEATSKESLLARWRRAAFAPVDNASLVFFRIAFGCLMLWEVWRYYSNDWIVGYWIKPRFLFKFYGFSWVQPWPDHGLYMHWAVLGVLAFFIVIGLFYRWSAVLFFLSYSYFFLLDETRYLNHAYLIVLFSFLLIFVPAEGAISVDAWRNPKLRSQTTPAWTLWLLRAQMGFVYFYGGLAKIAPDWLRCEPMRTRLSHQTDFPVIGRFFREEWAVYTMSYGGLLLDLLIVPFLLWRRTRVAAFCAAVLFHLMNARLFPIGVFPWLAMAATALFLSPSWPRRVLSIFRPAIPFVAPAGTTLPSRDKQRVALSFLAIYLAIQILLPLRPFLFPGGPEWTLMEHRFCWRMMLRDSSVHGFFYVTDPNINRTSQVNPGKFLTSGQMARVNWQPDMVLQFAHYLAGVMPQRGPEPLQVEARLYASVNGRKPELLVDPNVNLAAERRSLLRPSWLRPMHEPLPPPGIDLSDDPFAPSLDGN